MKVRHYVTVAVLVLSACTASISRNTVYAAGNWFYCSMSAARSGKDYVSDVFGGSKNGSQYAMDFKSYLSGSYGESETTGYMSSCQMGSSESSVREAKRQYVDNQRSVHATVVDTSWHP